MMNRRNFLDSLGVGSLVALSPTAAKYLRLRSNQFVDVTLVEALTKYGSNIMSNLVVTGQYSPTILDYGWSNLVKNHGGRLLNGTATQVGSGGALGDWKVT